MPNLQAGGGGSVYRPSYVTHMSYILNSVHAVHTCIGSGLLPPPLPAGTVAGSIQAGKWHDVPSPSLERWVMSEPYHNTKTTGTGGNTLPKGSPQNTECTVTQYFFYFLFYLTCQSGIIQRRSFSRISWCRGGRINKITASMLPISFSMNYSISGE